MKAVARALAGYASLLLLLALLLLPVYALALLLTVLLPPLLATITVAEARKQPRNVPRRLFLALIALPVVMLALLAPLRALLVGAFSFHPPALRAFQDAHAPLDAALEALLGERALPWLDVAWGLHGAVAILVVAILDSIRRNMLVRQIDSLPTAKVRSVAVGLAELEGTAVPRGDADPAVPILRSWLEQGADGYSQKTRVEPFHLDDGTGRILVDPRGAAFGSRGNLFSIALHQIMLRSQQGDGSLPEQRLMPGDRVYVLGRVQINDSAERGAEPLVIRPQRLSLLRLDLYDLFFLGHGGEQGLLQDFKGSIVRGWSTVVLLMAVSGWLCVNAWTQLVQMEQLRLDAAPPLARLLSAPTALERAMEVEGLGRRPAIDWIDELRGGRAASEAVLEALHRERLLRPALPVLRARATDIEHAEFGLINDWLARRNLPMPGHWGAEFAASAAAERGDTVLLRLLLSLEGSQLRVSYRAHFNQTHSINAGVTARKVVLDLTRLHDGPRRVVEFDAAPGWNARDRAVAFPDFAPGRYRLLAYPKRQFQGSLYDQGTRPMPAVFVELVPTRQHGW